MSGPLKNYTKALSHMQALSIDDVANGPSSLGDGLIQTMDKPLYERANVAKEDDEELQKLADKHKVGLIAYVGSYVGVRVSPSHTLTASIDLFDEFCIESVVSEFKNAGLRKAYFLINSFGGAMDSAYKIAKVLRGHLDEVTTFVPHIAASGGTLFSLVGNQIVMSPMSNITPLDPQMGYRGLYISATIGRRAFNRAVRFFEKAEVDESPYPLRKFADMLDPYTLTQMDATAETAKRYVEEILTLVGYVNADQIAQKLIWDFPTHNHVIGPDAARKLGLNVKDPADFQEQWNCMRNWLRKYLFQPQAENAIRYVLPTPAPSVNAPKSTGKAPVKSNHMVQKRR